MQKRQLDRAMYFKELATTSKKYYIPYIQTYKTIKAGMNVLEIGCGDGGNLLPFSKMGCCTTGVDIAEIRIKDAKRFFKESNAKGTFIASDVFKINNIEHCFDIIICHDVLEHISNKEQFLIGLKKFLSKDGIVFMSFPAWQMPFGGHQQICRSKVLSHLLFIHLLPTVIYRFLLKTFEENNGCIKELLSIKQTRISIEEFESLVKKRIYTSKIENYG